MMEIGRNSGVVLRTPFLLSIVWLLVSTTLACLFFSPTADLVGSAFSRACDFSAGGGSINLCGHAQAAVAIGAAWVFSVGALLGFRFWLCRAGEWRDYFSAVSYLTFVIPVNMVIYLVVIEVFDIGSRNARGEFNSWFIPFVVALNIFVFGRLSMRRAKKQQQPTLE